MTKSTGNDGELALRFAEAWAQTTHTQSFHDYIHHLAEEGMTDRHIATRLDEQGITVNYSTINRWRQNGSARLKAVAWPEKKEAAK